MKTKKLLSLVLSTAMVLGSAISVNADTVNNDAQSEVQAQTIGTASAEGTAVTGGYIPSDLDNNTPVYEPEFEAYSNDSLESKYPANGIDGIKAKYPEVRNQNPYGTCWAFSSIGLAEFDLINDGTADKNIDLSELQLAYFAYNSVVDPLGGTTGDYAKYYMDNTTVKYGFLNRGGNYEMAARRMTQWVGAASESDVPYSNVSNNGNSTENALEYLKNGISDEYAYKHDVAHLDNVYLINIKKQPEEVKKQIKIHGAVGIMYDQNDNNYQHCTNSYYDTAENNKGHAVMVVGWDDNYAKTNFRTEAQPTSDGAWLVRNSWGTYCEYFWMSYDTVSLKDTAWVFDFEKNDGYDNNYQLDGGVGVIKSTRYKKVANIFTTQKKDSIVSENLKAVSLSFTDAVNVNYTIEIYTDLTDITNPLSGTKQDYATTEGNTSYAGIYTIPLAATVNLKPGTNYSIVVTTDMPAIDYEVPVTGDVNYNNSMVWENYVSTSAVNQKSYYFYGTGLAYSNNWAWGNFCIKAFTSNVEASPLGDKLAGVSLYLDGKIGVNFYMNLPDALVNDSDAYMRFTLADGTVKTVKVAEAKARKVDGVTCYGFSCDVAAKEMTDEIKAEMVSSNGKVGKTYTYSVKDYANAALSDPVAYANVQNLMKALLNYGAASQQLFNYNTNKLANADLDEADKTISEADFSQYKETITNENSLDGLSYYGSSLVLKSDTTIKHYFQISDNHNISDYRITYTDASNNEIVVTPIEEQNGGNTYYAVSIPNTRAYDLDKCITVNVNYSSNQISNGLQIKFGPFSYCCEVNRSYRNNESLYATANTMYKYWQYAEEYKNSVAYNK